MRKRPSDRIHDVIEGKISGKHRGAWRLDSFGADESHEVRFRKGDNQAALWEIYDCTKAGKRVSGWAASAFRRLFMKVVAGQLTWSEAFGKIPERGQRRRVQTDAWLADVCGAFIQEVKAGAKIDNALFKKNRQRYGRGELDNRQGSFEERRAGGPHSATNSGLNFRRSFSSRF